jgi:hypothetical protein
MHTEKQMMIEMAEVFSFLTASQQFVRLSHISLMLPLTSPKL